MALAASKEVLAVYTVGAVELPLVSSLAYSVTNTLVPTLTLTHVKGDRDGFLRYWHGSVEKIATIMMPVFFYFLILAEPAMRLLFSAEFAAAAVPFRVYLFLLPLRLCSYGVGAAGPGRDQADSHLVARGPGHQRSAHLSALSPDGHRGSGTRIRPGALRQHRAAAGPDQDPSEPRLVPRAAFQTSASYHAGGGVRRTADHCRASGS